ncbi:MAG: hypothetical protein ACXAC0_10515 [Candidatus Thorarchaeota archaeon]
MIGFPQWDGWAVEVDPIFVGYISPGTTDSEIPQFQSVAHNPVIPRSSDAVTVSSEIYDIIGVSSATLQYSVDSGPWINVTMTQAGNAWSGTIPPQADGASIVYRVVAYDTVGNEAISGEHLYEVSDTATTTPTEPTTTPTEPGPGPGPGDDETLLMVYGAFGALVLIVLALGVRRRK